MTRVLFALALLALSPTVTAQDATLQEQHSEEIAALKNEIRELDSRLKELEQFLNPTGITSDERARILERARAMDSSSSNKKWHNASAWREIKRGMSRQQVIAILGQPTSSDDFHLFYEGGVTGQGVVSGNIFFVNNQVSSVSEPYFN